MRVKALHPMIYLVLLALRDNRLHMERLANWTLNPFLWVAIYLYPLKGTNINGDITLTNTINDINVGGTMLRMRQDYEDTIVMLGMKEYQQVLKKFKGIWVPLAKARAFRQG